MEKPATTIKRMMKEIEKRKIGTRKTHLKKVEQYVKELEGEDLSMLSTTALIEDVCNLETKTLTLDKEEYQAMIGVCEEKIETVRDWLPLSLSSTKGKNACLTFWKNLKKKLEWSPND
jgi:hypothetical protein